MRPITAADLMNPELLTARDHWTVAQLARFLLENEITGAPVESEDGELVGVVSLRDLVLCALGEEDDDYPDLDDQSWDEDLEDLEEDGDGEDDEDPDDEDPDDEDDDDLDDDDLDDLRALSLEDADPDDDLEPLLVEDVMNPEVFGVSDDASVSEVASLMLQQHLHRVVVFDDEDEAVGIISTSDLLGLLVEEG